MAPLDPRSIGISPDMYGMEIQDVEFLGTLIDSHPGWVNIVEFGTYIGLTTLYLGYAIQGRNGRLQSIDNSDSRPSEIKRAWLPHMTFYSMDILESPRNPGIESMIIGATPCLVVMDNGNKIQEVNNYAPIIPVGSAFCVHDFGTSSKQPDPTGEVDLEDIRDVLTKHHYAPVMHKEAEAIVPRCRFRCWVRTP